MGKISIQKDMLKKKKGNEINKPQHKMKISKKLKKKKMARHSCDWKKFFFTIQKK